MSYVESLARSLRQKSIAMGFSQIVVAPRHIGETVTRLTLKVQVASRLSKERQMLRRSAAKPLGTAIANLGIQGGNRVVERHNFLFFGAQATDRDRSIFKLTLTDRELDGHLGDAVFANLV